MFPRGILQQWKENQVSRSCQVSLKKARHEPLTCKLFLAFILCAVCCICHSALPSVRGQLAGKSALSTVFPGNKLKRLHPLRHLASPDL